MYTHKFTQTCINTEDIQNTHTQRSIYTKNAPKRNTYNTHQVTNMNAQKDTKAQTFKKEPTYLHVYTKVNTKHKYHTCT